MSVGKIALIGGGAFLAWKLGLLNALFGSSSASGGMVPIPIPDGPPPPTNPTAPPPGTPTWQLVLARAGGGTPMLTFDDWNWWYQDVTGQPGPDPTPYVGSNRGQKLQVSQWWAFMQQAKPGMTGVFGLGSYVRPQFFEPRGLVTPPVGASGWGS